MRSREYQLVNLKYALLHVRSFINKDEKGLDRFIRFYAKHRTLRFPDELPGGPYDVRCKDLSGYRCMIARRKNTRPDKVVLYLYGAAYFQAPKKSDYQYITEMIAETGYEVWFPLYPLAPDAKIGDVMVHIIAVYEDMLTEWKSDQILFQGNSSGACTVLYLLLNIKYEGGKLPYPGCAVLVSPALQMPPSEEQIERMKPLEKTDHVIPIQYCISFAKMFREPAYDYLMTPFELDWSGLPRMMFVYGDKEIFFGYVPDLKKKIKECHLHVRLLIGHGMMHTFPFQDDTPEGREGKRRIWDFMKHNGNYSVDL